VPYAFLDPGSIAFHGGMGALYALAALRIWRRSKAGLWVLAIVILLWGAIILREGHLPPLEGALAFVCGPLLALAGRRELMAEPTTRLGLAGWAIIALVALATTAAAPLWHCHLGFGGEFHCHSIVVNEHAH